MKIKIGQIWYLFDRYEDSYFIDTINDNEIIFHNGWERIYRFEDCYDFYTDIFTI